MAKAYFWNWHKVADSHMQMGLAPRQFTILTFCHDAAGANHLGANLPGGAKS